MDDIQEALQNRVAERDLGSITREQHEGRPMAELAPWLFPIRDNLIVNKDSGLMSCWEFEALDTDGAAKVDMAAMAESLNRLMVHQQEEPLMFWWTVRRTASNAYPVSEFPDDFSRSIDNGMKSIFLAGKNYINRHYLSAVLQSSSGIGKFQERVGNAIKRGQSAISAVTDALKSILDDQRIFAYSPAELEETCERFERIAADLSTTLPDSTFRRLRREDLGGFLHGMISPATAFQERVALPGVQNEGSDEPHDFDMPAWLDEALPEGRVTPHGDYLEFSAGGRKKYAVAVTIAKFESQHIPNGALDRLYSIPGELTINYTVRMLTRREAEALAEKQRNYNEGKKFSWKAIAKAAFDKGSTNNAPVNPGRQRMANEANQALGDFTQGSKAGIYFYMSVICYGDTLDEADKLAERVDQVFRHAHLVPEREEMHLLSSWATSIPGMWKENARWKPWNTKAFSMIAPVHTIGRGQVEAAYLTEQTKQYSPALAVLPTDYNTPYYFSPYVGDLGHGFIAGPSRAGKSVLANLLGALFRRYPDAQIIWFDKDYSSRIPILLQGGNYLDFNAENGKRFNPYQWLDEGNLEYRMNWTELMLSRRGFSVGAEDTKDLERAMRGTMGLTGAGMKRLKSIYASLTRADLKKEMENWLEGRVDGKYFDNAEDGFDLSHNLVGVEIGKLLTNPRVAIPAMDYCFGRIKDMLVSQRELGIVRPTFIYIAEVWHVLKEEQYADEINNLLKTLAKLCAVMWMDTQSVEDLLNSNIFASLRDNIPNRIYAVNRNLMQSESLRRLYHREFGLTDNQIDFIAKGRRKQDYLFQQTDLMSRGVRLHLPKPLLAGLRSDMAAQICFDKWYRDGNPIAPDWKEQYLREVQGV